MQVAAQLTPDTPEVVAGAMIWAYEQVTGRTPPARSSWIMPLAQSAFETAHWTAMRNFNAGFITAASGPYFILGGGNQLHFISYATLGQGCLDFMRWLQKCGALAAADVGDLAGYIAGLRSSGYLGNGGDYATYQAGIAAIMNQYTSVVPVPYSEGSGPLALPPMSTTEAVGISLGVVIAAALAAYALSPKSRRPGWPRPSRASTRRVSRA